MRVAAISSEGSASPSFRVRTALPAAALAGHGVSLEPLPLLAGAEAKRFLDGSLAAKVAVSAGARRRLHARLESELDGLDAVLVHRRVDPFPSLRLERLARRAGRLVYDVDDAIWLDRARGGRSHPLAALKGSARKSRWLAGNADHVIAGNAILAEHLSRYAATVSVVPSVVDTDRVGTRSHADAPELVLGWIGSRSTAPFVSGIGAALRRVAAELGDVRLRLLMVGGSVPPPPGIGHEARPWSPEAQDDALRRMDVGLMPLPDTPWNRGKCAYKALQYMAAGVPVVADDVGIAADVVGDGTAGFAVRGDDQWVESLLALMRDRGLRARLGAEGRRRVERDYSLARWAPELAAIVRGDQRSPGGGTASSAR